MLPIFAEIRPVVDSEVHGQYQSKYFILEGFVYLDFEPTALFPTEASDRSKTSPVVVVAVW